MTFISESSQGEVEDEGRLLGVVKCLIETLFRGHANITLSNFLVRFSEVGSCDWFDGINCLMKALWPKCLEENFFFLKK